MEILDALNRFIESFENLNHGEMMKCFSENSTSFFPINHYPTKINGKPEISSRFQEVISKIKNKGIKRISLPVSELDITNNGKFALVTFQIHDTDISRRSIVMKKTGEDWYIQHLHASNAPLEIEK